MRIFLAALAMALGLGPVTTMAQDNPVVVELYTSQGCSSCPPADEMLLDLAARDDVIALALHVDYWDYIGWVDSFAHPGFTQRQQAYARAAGHSSVYTPQMVIGGVDHVVGTKPMDVADLINAHRRDASGVTLQLSRSGAALSIDAEAQARFSGRALVQVVRYTPRAVVDIMRGENAGREMVYGNIVTEWRVVGEWDGRAPLDMNVEAAGDQPVVVIVQAPGPGPILAAARLP